MWLGDVSISQAEALNKGSYGVRGMFPMLIIWKIEQFCEIFEMLTSQFTLNPRPQAQQVMSSLALVSGINESKVKIIKYLLVE